MKQSDVLLRASVWDATANEWTRERNIRKVKVIYVGDVTEQEDVKIVVVEGEMYDYHKLTWVRIYGELGMKLNPGQTLDKPVFVPFDDLAHIEWSTNRFERAFVLGSRNL